MPAVVKKEKGPAGHHGWPERIRGHALFVSTQRLDALGAEILAHAPPILQDRGALDIGLELPFRSHVRVADIVPKTSCLTATLALGHWYHPLETSPLGDNLQCKGDRNSVATRSSVPQIERFRKSG
jgi:hypothetical protein